uniref:Uncharacterized protein n=1 Tax=viral metagenome TaxID=1070528 RepID=A0A6C0C392_9ZZZZ
MIVFYIKMNKIQPSTIIEGYTNQQVKQYAARSDASMNHLLTTQTADLRSKIDNYKAQYNNPIMDLTGVYDEFKITPASNPSTQSFDLKDSAVVNIKKANNYVSWINNEGNINISDFNANPEKYYIEITSNSFDLKSYDNIDTDVNTRTYTNIKKYSSLSVSGTTITLDGYNPDPDIDGTDDPNLTTNIYFKIHKIKDEHLKKYHYTGPHVTIGENDKNSLANALLEDTNVYIQQNEQIFALGAMTVAILSVGSYVLFRK